MNNVFIITHTTGWLANITRQHLNNKITRPTANDTGPDNQKFVSLK